MLRSASFPQFSQPRPDPIRIAAISASIAANVALFAFLMAPMSYSPPAEQRDSTLPLIIIPKHEDPIKAPVEPPILKHPDPKPLPKPVPRPPTPPQPPPTDHSGPVDPPAQPPKPPAIDPPKPDDGGAVARVSVGRSLNPLVKPAPMYPVEALRDGVTGIVTLELLVGTDGRVLEARIAHSSGDRRLDAAARDQVLRNWRFQPAVQNGMPVQALGIVPIAFSLD